MLDRPDRDQLSNDLVARWQTHRDERARDRLTTMHWPLIRAYGSRMASKWGVDVDDATQEAALGFLRALDTYSPELGTLATYVATWARQRITRYRDDAGGTIRLPVHVAVRNRLMSRAWAKLRRDLRRAPTSRELADALGWPEERVLTVREASLVSGQLASTSTPVGEDGDSELGDFLEADEDARPDVRALGRHEVEQARAALLQAAELLPERWRSILMLRLVEGRTLTETGEALGVTRERIRQIETRLLARMREALRFDARALNFIGLEVNAPETVERADADGLRLADIASVTGLTTRAVEVAIIAGTFPEADRHAHHRGTRLWDRETVAKWQDEHEEEAPAPRDTPEARIAPKPRTLLAGLSSTKVASILGVTTRTLHNWIADERFPAPIDRSTHHWRWNEATVRDWVAARHASAAAEVASLGTSSPDTAEVAPRPPCAPALALSLMGGSSLLAMSAAVQDTARRLRN